MAQESASLQFGLLEEEIELLNEECNDKLNEVEHDLMDVVEDRADKTPDFLNRIFRAFHSVKGAADFLGNPSLKKLSHAAENVLGAVREGRIDLTSEHAETLLSTVARLRLMIGDGGQPVDFSREEQDLKLILPRNRESLVQRANAPRPFPMGVPALPCLPEHPSPAS